MRNNGSILESILNLGVGKIKEFPSYYMCYIDQMKY